MVWCLVWSHSCVVCSDPCPGGWWWRWPALAPLLHTTYLAMGGTVCQARSLISVSLSPSLCPDRNISWRISPLPPLLYPRYPSARNLQLTEFNLIKCFASGSSCSRCLIRKKEAKVQEWRSALDKLVGLIFDCLDSQLNKIRIHPWLQHSISIITNDVSIFYFY